MSARFRSTPVNRWLEPLFCLVIAGGVIYALQHMYLKGYLPQPFFYDPGDIWGDWFNVVYWGYDKGTYDAWGSLYPPMSFVFTRIFSLPQCYPLTGGAVDGSAGMQGRGCDWLGHLTTHAIYVVNAVLVARCFIKNDRRTALWRSFALVCGLPMLEAFEHANLVMITFTFVVLGYGPLLRTTRARWLCIAVAINFKVYLVATIFPFLLRRRWLWFEGAMLATVMVYLVTYAMLGRGTIAEIIQNIGVFSSGQASRLLDVWFAATYLPLESLLDNWESPMEGLIGSRLVGVGLLLIRLTRLGTQFTIALAAAAVWLRPEVISRHRLVNLGLSMALISTEAGGYTPIMMFFFTFLEPWRGFGVKVAIIACYILCIPIDLPVQEAVTWVQATYFPGRTIFTTYYIMAGPFVRPLVLLAIPAGLSWATIHAVWRDVRDEGWRGRWRFRYDAPVLLRLRRLPAE